MTPRERFVAAARNQPVDQLPVWIMRQAGRYLPSYRSLRAQYGFLDLCRDPALAAEVTQLPLAEIDVDALVFFSDILIPLDGIGVGISFDTGKPEIPEPLRSESDLNRLKPFDPAATAFVAAGLRQVREAQPDRALLGFAGAPFTLAMYAIQGQGSKEFERGRAAMQAQPDFFIELMRRLTDMTLSYLDQQIEAGVDAVQLFDSWAGLLDETQYRAMILPWHKAIFKALKGRVPTVLFSRGTAHVLKALGESGADVISLDWRIPVAEADAVLPSELVIQGNLDPTTLYTSPEVVQLQATRNLQPLPSGRSRIANLGHGILPQTPVENARAFVDAAHAVVPSVAL